MDKFYNEILSKLETAINELEIENVCPTQQLNEFVDIIQSTIGKEEGKSARLVLDEVLKNKK